MHAPDTATPTIAPVARLGDYIDRRATGARAFGAPFADLCVDAFGAVPLEGVTPHGILRWLATTSALPAQGRTDQSFGQPSITLFRTERFRIEALFWLTGTTAIHQHGFAGAFMVLDGSSLQSTFEFTAADRSDPAVVTGDLALRASELLPRGSCRRIDPGGSLIHSLFHLDMPSVTLVIRTHREEEHGPEYVYYPPTLAVDPSVGVELTKKRMQALDLLMRVESPALDALALEMVDHADLATALQVLLRLRLNGRGRYDVVSQRVAERHPRHAAAIARAVEEEWRRALITAMRRTVTDPAHRLFLALVMNVPTREPIAALLRAHRPDGDAPALILQWSREIAARTPLAIDLDGDGCLSLLRWTLAGESAAGIEARCAASAAPETLRILHARMRAHFLFAPLFASSAAQVAHA